MYISRNFTLAAFLFLFNININNTFVNYYTIYYYYVIWFLALLHFLVS
jgi:hypothetical protein